MSDLWHLYDPVSGQASLMNSLLNWSVMSRRTQQALGELSHDDNQVGPEKMVSNRMFYFLKISSFWLSELDYFRADR